MSIKIGYKANPFSLDDEAIKWVEDTLRKLREKGYSLSIGFLGWIKLTRL